MDLGAWQATVYGAVKSWTQLSAHVRKPIQIFLFVILRQRVAAGIQ